MIHFFAVCDLSNMIEQTRSKTGGKQWASTSVLAIETLIDIQYKESPDTEASRLDRTTNTGVTICACMRFAGVIRSGYLVLANQHTSSEGQVSRDLRQTRVEPY